MRERREDWEARALLIVVAAAMLYTGVAVTGATAVGAAFAMLVAVPLLWFALRR